MASILPLQPSLVIAKSVGVMLVVNAPVIAPPPLVTVNVCAPLGMLCCTAPNESVSGMIDTALGFTPVPVGAGFSVAVPPVPALTETAPVRTTALVGLNCTRTTQEVDFARVVVLAQSPVAAGVASEKSVPPTVIVSGAEVTCSP